MYPVILALMILWGLLFPVGIPNGAPEGCDGPYQGKGVTPPQLADVLVAHRKGLFKEPGGQLANLCQADLATADLHGANLRLANLQQADFQQADLQDAHLDGANLQETNLISTNLQNAHLFKANLHKADLQGANLHKADLQGANLSETSLIMTELAEARLSAATLLRAAVFEPRSLPSIQDIAFTQHLSTMQFHHYPQALHELREAFKKAGLRQQEREVTYAIKRSQRGNDWRAGFFKQLESVFNLVFFELTSAYGMAPGRPLLLLVGLMPCFAIPYALALRSRGEAGIWAVWLPERVHKHPGEDKPVRVTEASPLPPPWPTGRGWKEAGRVTRAVLIGLYFSLLSAFHIGWRELNVGNWLARLQPREYVLRATGWVRVVAGLQSLISVYLLALWALTYFGRPFE